MTKMTKRCFIMLGLLIAMMFSLTVTASATDALVFDSKAADVAEGEYAVRANGQWVTFSDTIKPYDETVDNTTTIYLPLKAVAEALNCEVSGSGDTYTVKYGKFSTDAPVVLKGGAAYAPLSFWTNSFAEVGVKTSGNANTKQVSIFLRSDLPYLVRGEERVYEYQAGEHYYGPDDLTMTYRKTEVISNPGQKSYLIVFLHGSSMRGTDNANFLALGGAVDVADYLTERGINFTLILPQFATSGWPHYKNVVADLVKTEMAGGSIDPSRVYIMGGSMGGEGTWHIVEANPHLFAAAMPVAFFADRDAGVSGGLTLDYNNLLDTPLMVVSGEKDTMNAAMTTPAVIEESYRQLLAMGAEIRYTEMPGLDHGGVCEKAFTTEHLDWVFSHVRKEKTFIDVRENDYFRDAANWAAAKHILGEIGDRFAPDTLSTRAEVVCYLWRAAGCPEPAAASLDIADVSPDTYYYKALLWAAEKGIINTAFDPDGTFTRAEIVTLLYQAAGSPAVTTKNSFADVGTSVDYINAVVWAVSAGVTNGTTNTTFEPQRECTRSEIVTFLCRFIEQ